MDTHTLALHGVTEDEVRALLAAGVSESAVARTQPSETFWIAYPLPVGEYPAHQQRPLAITHPPMGSASTLLLLGWPVEPQGRAAAARARAALAQLEDAVAAVIVGSALADHVRELEVAAAQREALFREVEEARAEWAQTFDAVSDPISVITPDYRLVRANVAYTKLFGLNREQCKGQECFAAAPGRDAPCAECPLPRALETKQPGFVEQERLVASGPHGIPERRAFQVWTYPVLDAQGDVERVVEIMKDMTQQERLRQVTRQAEALREADHLKAELLGTVSHELRSPLAAIKGYAATLLRHERRLPREERHEFLLAIDEATDRLEVIIDRLLQISQLETGTLPVQRAPVDLALIGRAAIAAIEEPSSRDASRRFTFSLHLVTANGTPAPGVPLVIADPRLMRHVLDNLLENAVKYSPEGGAIAVTLGPASRDHTLRAESSLGERAARDASGTPGSPAPPDGHMLEMRVRDHGVGIPAEHLGRIFDRFHRVDTRLTREVDGLGLGLAICKRIIELHGGVIWAESMPGEGSTFHVLLPTDDSGVLRAAGEEN
jgi:PAS domain S-box-containing protein